MNSDSDPLHSLPTQTEDSPGQTPPVCPETPPFVEPASKGTQSLVAGAGDLIAGKYTLVERLGEGGMGEVWVARQSEPIKRTVALKLIKKGLDSQFVIARFEAERQSLAVMDHPHIARILDGGVTYAGAPFFVMELVSGLPVVDFCDQARLRVPDRLRLFAAICQAVQHAHQKGIVHRDLKPSNILVTLVDGKPTPKVIDFGVAKALSGKLTDETVATQVGTVVGTLEYMAPEQAGLNTQDIDTRADIYSLGVILYELLTGLRPFDSERLRKAGLHEILRILREEDPPSLAARLATTGSLATAADARQLPPRQLLATLKGELNWIVARCLEKDRSRRFESASSLARDIERYLANEPIEARPASATYRLRKLYRRNRAMVLAAGLVLIALIGGIIGTTWGLIRAEDQRHLAENKEQEADAARQEAENEAREEEKAKILAQAQTKRAEEEKARADAKTEEARHALYAARQQVALNAWRENRADVLAEVVERQKPGPGERDLRGFEWGYLDRLARAPGRRWRHAGPMHAGLMVNGVALAPDDGKAVTVGFDARATAWDVATSKPLWDTGTALRFSVNAVAVAPDGKQIALAGHVGQLQLWGIDGKLQARLDGHGAQVFGVAFSPSGKLLASAGADWSVRLWDVSTRKSAGVLSPVWPVKKNVPGPQIIPRANPKERTGHTDMVWQVAWAPDGQQLASCSSDGSIKIWAVSERRLKNTFWGHEGIVVSVAWSPDGRLVASASRPPVGAGGGEIKVWNVDTGRAESTFRPPSGGLDAVAFTPDGLYVVTAGEDRTVRVWRKDGRQVTEQRGFRDPVRALALSNGGRWALAGTRTGEIVAFDLDNSSGKRSTITKGLTRLAFAEDGKLAALRDGAVYWYNPETLAETAHWPVPALPGKKSSNAYSSVAAFTMGPDGSTAHCRNDFIGRGTVVWRDPAGKVVHLLVGHAALVSAIAFLPGNRLASADQEGEIRIWDGPTGNTIASLHPWEGPVRFLVARPDGGLWAAGAPWAVGSRPEQSKRPTAKEGRLVRIENGQVVWASPLPAGCAAADISREGSILVIAGDDGSLVWLDAREGKEVRRRPPATGAIASLRISSTGKRIATGGRDGMIRLLDVDSGEELLVLDGTGSVVEDVAFSPDDRQLAAVTASVLTGGSIIVWDRRQAEDWPPLPVPDVAWHKSRLGAAAGAGVLINPPARDTFAMRYHLTRLAALEPNDLQWPRSLVALDQEAGDYAAAATRLEDIVHRWPGEAPMWYDLGNARRAGGDVAAAEAAFRKAIALDPALPEPYCNLGQLLVAEGRFGEALEFLGRGHERGLALQKSGKPWHYPSAAWLARCKRLKDLADRYGNEDDFAGVPSADRLDVIEVLALAQRPLAAARLADPKLGTSPGPVVTAAALRCAEGMGDAASLTAAEKSAWRTKALAWLRLDYERFLTMKAAQRASQCAALRGHPLLQIARGPRLAAWSEEERVAWRQFWADVDATARGPKAP
jgi:eukaryotic-like serine/threonine-protein kinase